MEASILKINRQTTFLHSPKCGVWTFDGSCFSPRLPFLLAGKNTHDLTPHHGYLGGVKNRNGSSHLKWRNDWFVIFSLFKFILPWKNPKHLHRSPGGSFFYTRPVDNITHITHPKNKKKIKKVHVSQAPETWENLNTFHFSTCRPSTLPFLSCRWIQASMKRCASMMCMESLGSGYMGNRPSSWVCGSDEEMMGDVSFSVFFLNSIDQTMSVQ